MTNSNLSPNLPPDRVDGVLGEYFKAQVPKPFPAAPKTGVVRPANRPAAAGVDPMAHSRWALAACVVVLLIGCWTISSQTGDGKRRSGANLDNSTANSKILKDLGKRAP